MCNYSYMIEKGGYKNKIKHGGLFSSSTVQRDIRYKILDRTSNARVSYMPYDKQRNLKISSTLLRYMISNKYVSISQCFSDNRFEHCITDDIRLELELRNIVKLGDQINSFMLSSAVVDNYLEFYYSSLYVALVDVGDLIYEWFLRSNRNKLYRLFDSEKYLPACFKGMISDLESIEQDNDMHYNFIFGEFSCGYYDECELVYNNLPNEFSTSEFNFVKSECIPSEEYSKAITISFSNLQYESMTIKIATHPKGLILKPAVISQIGKEYFEDIQASKNIQCLPYQNIMKLVHRLYDNHSLTINSLVELKACKNSGDLIDFMKKYDIYNDKIFIGVNDFYDKANVMHVLYSHLKLKPIKLDRERTKIVMTFILSSYESLCKNEINSVSIINKINTYEDLNEHYFMYMKLLGLCAKQEDYLAFMYGLLETWIKLSK